MNEKDLGKEILEAVGGEANIISLVHCATRLRFKLKNRDRVDKAQVENITGVISVVEGGGQFQIVIGNTVSDVYKAIGALTDLTKESNQEDNEEKGGGSAISRLIDVVTAIFTPALGALAGSGILKGLLMILTSAGWLSIDSGTYQILFAASDSIMYFLPMILAYSAAKKFGSNPALAITLAGALIYPNIVELMNEGATITLEYRLF